MSNEHGHAENWRKWLAHLMGTPAIGLELGTWKGESAEWLLDHVFTHEKANFYCVDTFEGSVEHHLGGIDCTVNEKETRHRLARFAPKVAIWKKTTNEALRFAWYAKQDDKALRFDFIYVDASHDAMNVLRDTVLAFDLLKEGGTLIWDDYEWQVMPEAVDRPKIAITAFLECYAKQLEIVSFGGWQVCIRKIK
jgi:predicted O-methyltransferase YrrM